MSRLKSVTSSYTTVTYLTDVVGIMPFAMPYALILKDVQHVVGMPYAMPQTYINEVVGGGVHALM